MSRATRELFAKLNKDFVKKKTSNELRAFSSFFYNREAHLLYRTKIFQFLFQYFFLTAIWLLSQPEGHREPRNEVESLGLAERPVGFEPGTSRF